MHSAYSELVPTPVFLYLQNVNKNQCWGWGLIYDSETALAEGGGVIPKKQIQYVQPLRHKYFLLLFVFSALQPDPFHYYRINVSCSSQLNI